MGKFTVYLIKEDYNKQSRYYVENDIVQENKKSIFSFGVVLEDNQLINEFILKKNIEKKRIYKADSKYEVYYRNTPPKDPDWKDFWNINNDIKTSSACAIVVLEKNNRIFVVCHGFSAHLINAYAIISDFGLKAALNLIDKEKINSTDFFTPSEIALRTRKQSGKSANFDEYEINIYNTLLKDIAGRVKEEYKKYFLSKQLEGADRIRFSFNGTNNEFQEQLGILFDFYNQNNYKKNGFEWVDYFTPLRDKTRIDELNELLIQAIDERDENLIINIPEIYDSTIETGFKFNCFCRCDTVFTDFDIKKTYYKLLDDNLIDKINLDILHTHQLQIIFLEDKAIKGQAFPLYKCIYFETNIENRYYFLEAGSWYEVDKDFIGKIDDVINNIILKPFNYCLSYNKIELEKKYYKYNSHEIKRHELWYNMELANNFNSNGKKAELMDEASKRIGKDHIEVCDVIIKDSGGIYLLHNKYKYGSSALSHLFNQGNVSAKLLTDESFRKKVNEKINDDELKFPENDIFHPGNYTIVYGIISKKDLKGNFSIPLFSKITLKEHIDNFGFMSYKVRISFIEDLTFKEENYA